MYFVCHTAYHTYISCIRCMVGNIKASIVLMDNIPNAEKIADRIKQTGVFETVKVIRHNEFLPSFSQKSFHVAYFAMRLLPQKAKEKLGFLLEADRIVLFNDYSNVGAFLMQNKKQYSLYEDGCNTFTRDGHRMSGRAQWAKRVLFKCFGIPYAIGMKTLCQGIEVNDAANLRTEFPFPVTEMNRKELITQLTERQRKQLLDIYLVELNLLSNRKAALVLTEPLLEEYVVKTTEEQAALYEAKLIEYVDQYDIYIKAHPRDKTDYSRILGGRVRIIDRTIPVEILNLKRGILFDLGLVTDGSTSMFTVECCKEMRGLKLV